MGSRKDYNEKLLAICQKVSSLTYSDLKTKYSTDFLNKIKDYKIAYGDFSVVDRLELKIIDADKKSKLKDIIKKIQDVEYIFNSEDIPNLNLFTSSIDSTVNHNQYISNIKNGTSNYLLGKTGIKYELEIDLLFNEIKKYDKLNDFLSNSTINPIFTTQGNFKSFLTVLFVIFKNCQDIKYPLYYKYYQGILKWFYDIPRGDYDSFYDIYQQVDISDTPKAVAFDVYYHFLGIEIKNEIEIQKMANSIQDRNYLESEIFNYSDESFKFINNSTTDIQIKFRDWLTVNFTKSADKYFSYFNTANKISINTELGDLYKWTEDEWSINESQLRENEDFIEKNTKGHNNLTASIGQFKKFLSMEKDSIVIPPIIPFPEFKWRWAVTTPSEGLNTEELLLGVLSILVKHDGKKHATQEFKDDLLELEISSGTKIGLAKVDRELKKNIIENSGQYWKALGLLNSTTDGTISVTDLGKGIINGSITKLDFIKKLYNEFSLPNLNIESQSTIDTWKTNNVEVFPIKIIFDILFDLTKHIQSPTEWYIEPNELKNVIIPLSIYKDLDIEVYIQNILEYRKDNSKFSLWPNCAPGDNDFRMIKEYLLFLSNFGFLDFVELKDNSKRYYINSYANSILKEIITFKKEFKIIKKTNKYSLNQIFYGPPGTGKTFNTFSYAISIIKDYDYNEIIERQKNDLDFKSYIENEYEECVKNGQLQFITFHQSYSYEEFIEGIRPDLSSKTQLSYKLEDGLFKALALKAKDNPDENYVLIIDEINRGNISRIFGELITLIEPSKRLFNYPIEHPQEVILPYSKSLFGVPNNLYIIGTMNTADRSITNIDTALRRRFVFEEFPSLHNHEMIKTVEKNGLFINLQDILRILNERIEYLLDRDHLIGHSYFIGVNDWDTLCSKFRNNIIPLLQEYFYNDWEKIALVLGDNGDAWDKDTDKNEKFILKKKYLVDNLFGKTNNIEEEYDDNQYYINPKLVDKKYNELSEQFFIKGFQSKM
jgi:hypothetical protein